MTDQLPGLGSRADELRRWLGSGQANQHVLSAGYQGTTYLYEDGGPPLVVKLAHGSGLAARVRRWMIQREYRVYRRLAGLPGFPVCYQLLDDSALVLEFVEGRSLREADLELPDREVFYATLLETLQRMHEAGVAHGDLKRKDNILVRSGSDVPCVIDLGAAVRLKRENSVINRWVFRATCRADFNAWVKHKYRRQYDAIEPADAGYYQPTLAGRLFGRVRDFWRIISLRQTRKAHRRRKAGIE